MKRKFLKVPGFVVILTLEVSELRSMLSKCAETAMNSKLIRSHKEFFTKMVVDAVLFLDRNDLDDKLIGIKKVPGGAMQVTILNTVIICIPL
jgi:T-complex protein 1 subunit eta